MPTSPSWPSLDSHTSAKLATSDSSMARALGRRVSWGGGLVRLTVGAPAAAEVALHDPIGQRRHREMGQGTSDIAVDVPVLKSPGQHHLQRGAGHHAELAGLGTARARRQEETATPMPPWMISGSGPRPGWPTGSVPFALRSTLRPNNLRFRKLLTSEGIDPGHRSRSARMVRIMVQVQQARFVVLVGAEVRSAPGAVGRRCTSRSAHGRGRGCSSQSRRRRRTEPPRTG